MKLKRKLTSKARLPLSLVLHRGDLHDPRPIRRRRLRRRRLAPARLLGLQHPPP